MANLTVSSSVDLMMQASSASGIRNAIGAVNYPNFSYTTDFQSGTEQTRNLTSITNLSGYNENTNLTSIYVGSNVTSIGSAAFFYCTSLSSVTIGNGVISISGAFDYCTSLTSITIPDSVETIGDYTFSYCTSLTSITLPNRVETIGSGAFYYCTSLTSITIPNSVTSIGSSAFYYCSSLATINCLATTAPTLGSNAFYGVAATDIHVPVGATGYSTTYGGLTVVADL